MKLSLKTRLLNIYLSAPMFFDIVFCSLIILISRYSPPYYVNIKTDTLQSGIISSIIGTQISLAGFILAALTIIVTFKSNLKSKGIEDADNALDMLFASEHYDKIVSVFKTAIIELSICSLILFIIWSLADNISLADLFLVNIFGIGITSLSVFRSLYVLFVVLSLSKHKRH